MKLHFGSKEGGNSGVSEPHHLCLRFAAPGGGWLFPVLVIKNSPTAFKSSTTVVASCRLPLIGPKAVTPHQDIAGGHSRLMGSQLEKVDFEDVPKVGQRPDRFMNTPLRLNFLSGAMPLLGRPILSFMYRDKV